MSGTKKLHDQPLITSVDIAQHRIALGYPTKVAADNMLATVFMRFFLKYGQGVSVIAGNNTITFDTAFESGVTNYVVFISSTNGVGYQIGTKSNTGFDVEFLDSDTIDYLCLKI